jgi:hypothetical protein
MSTWVGMGPVIGPGSLDGFAIGVMMSGAFFMALTAPRRARRRPAVAAGTTGILTAGSDWLPRRSFRHPGLPRSSRASRIWEMLGEPGASGARELSGPRMCAADAFEPGAFGADAFEPGVFEAGAFGPSPFGAGPFAPGAERLAQPEDPGAYSDAGWLASIRDDDRAAGGRRSRHRLNEPVPGTTSPDRTPRGGTSRDSGHRGGANGGGARRSSGAFPDSAFPDSAFPDSAFPDSAFPASAFPDRAFPDSALPDDLFPETRFPDVALPDEEPLDAEWLDPAPDLAPDDAGLLDSIPGMPPRDAGRLEPLPDRSPREHGRRESPFPDWASRDDRPFPAGASRDRGRPDVEFPDIAFPDGTFGTSKRPEARRLPRHAAPAVGLGSKVSHWMTGLFARPATSGARG